MRKPAAITLAALLFCVFSGFPAFGVDTVDSAPVSEQATEAAPAEQTETVYYVEVEWGRLEFTAQLEKVWNPLTLQYEEGFSDWQAVGTNTVTIKNSSNVPVAVMLTGVLDGAGGLGTTAVIISDDGSISLSAITGQTAVQSSFIVTLAGKPDGVFAQRTIATLTLTISQNG